MYSVHYYMEQEKRPGEVELILTKAKPTNIIPSPPAFCYRQWELNTLIGSTRLLGYLGK